LTVYIGMGIGQRDDMGGMRGGVDESTFGRLYTWSAATEMALRRPLTGVGLNNFVEVYNEYRAGFDNRNHAVHSMWFAVLAEIGFPGLIIFILMIRASFKSISRSKAMLAAGSSDPVLRATALALSGALGGVCAAGSFLNQAFTWPIYIIIAFTASLVSLAAPRPLPTIRGF
jgi:putative inorganic carbon (HCO3(-)) transporter